jgi:nicotinamidase-related amidase
MNSPLWIRKNIGNKNKRPGLPFQDSNKFNKWVSKYIGNPIETTPVLMGLTIDCCVLSTSQEFSWRGFYPLILEEAVDHATGKTEDKERILKSPVPNWAEVIKWKELRTRMDNGL